MNEPTRDEVELPPLDVTDHDREAFRAQYEYKYPYSEEVTLGASLRCRERQLLAEMKVSAGLRAEVTESWHRAENYANALREVEAEAELQSLRERAGKALGGK